MSSLTHHWMVRLLLIGNLLGVLLMLLALAMLPCSLLALYDHSADLIGFQLSTAFSAALGLGLFGFTFRWARHTQIGHREGFLIVALAWIAAGLVGAFPFWLFAHFSPDKICDLSLSIQGADGFIEQLPIGQEFCQFTNAAFESFSGFTTTGATIIQDGLWETADGLTADGRMGLPRALLLWRMLSHWMGGMGIIVLGVAILPLLGVGGMQLLRAEVPGPTTDKLAPRIRETARLLYKLYILLTLALFVLLMLGGMTPFEALCHSFSTMATGGFSTRQNSIAGFQSAYIEWLLCLFMFLGGVNFTLHFAALQRKWFGYLKDAEFRTYLLIVISGSIVIAWTLCKGDESRVASETYRSALFQTLSILTTTGFSTEDYTTWYTAPVASLVIMVCMCCSGMAGSTSGGPKLVRHMISFKLWLRELFLLSHPKATRPVLLAGKPVPEEVLRSTISFLFAYIALWALGTLCMTSTGLDLQTGMSVSLSSLGNIGPGFGSIGPSYTYLHLSDTAKWISMVLMLFGRLEVYTLLVLFTPSFWRR